MVMSTIIVLVAMTTAANAFTMQDKSFGYKTWLSPMEVPKDLLPIIYDAQNRDSCEICKGIVDGIAEWMMTINNINDDQVLNFLKNGCNLAFSSGYDVANNYWCQHGMDKYLIKIVHQLVSEYGNAQDVCHELGECSTMIMPMPITSTEQQDQM